MHEAAETYFAEYSTIQKIEFGHIFDGGELTNWTMVNKVDKKKVKFRENSIQPDHEKERYYKNEI